jgi:Protein of unknown function (DUF1622)
LDSYRSVRRSLGRAILLGLEFLVAGGIIRTVAVAPSLTSVAVLGVIVLIRTFLSASLEVERSKAAGPGRKELRDRDGRPGLFSGSLADPAVVS